MSLRLIQNLALSLVKEGDEKENANLFANQSRISLESRSDTCFPFRNETSGRQPISMPKRRWSDA